jgi:hypothetical protein
MNDERLAFILRAPALVERVVRGTVREALRSRRYRSGPLDVRTFATAALSELDRIALDRRGDVDALGRLELQNATVSAAGCFASSAVARRLFSVAHDRYRAAPPEADAVLSDGRGSWHAVRLELLAGADARLHVARAVARAAASLRRDYNACQVHLFSLRDGRLRSYDATASGMAERGATHDVA